MDMTEYVKQILREEGITQSELASRVKWSRQRVFDILKRNNSNYNSINAIMDALGRKMVICRKDGKEPDFNVEKLYDTIKEYAPLYGKLEAILDAMGYKIEIVKK
jgi:transcriptional regulator